MNRLRPTPKPPQYSLRDKNRDHFPLWTRAVRKLGYTKALKLFREWRQEELDLE